MKPLFWFSILGLLLMILGFFIQQAAKIPSVERLVAPHTADAKYCLSLLQKKRASAPRSMGFAGDIDSNPYVSVEDVGFKSLSKLYSDSIHSPNGSNTKTDRIVRFVDALALVPDKRGFANLIIIEWAYGQQTDTSYEEIRDLISQDFDRSLWPLQFWLFVIGFLVQVATIAVTHFRRKRKKEIHYKTSGHS